VQLNRVRPTVVQVTLHAYELAGLMAAVRYVVDSAPSEIPQAARDQLGELLADYDQGLRRLAPVAERGATTG
jgi:imidazolonepropionase-like amidohydrolase